MFEQLGPYRIEHLLGRGGMGVVYAAVDVNTQQRAAVKVLSPALSEDESFRERFSTEIETLKQLTHPNIVQLYGFGEQGGHLFYAMELVSGRSLQDELNGGRRFSWREVTQIGVQICRGLKHAHDHGIIHRDLKPANLLAAEGEQIKLSDFGIAKLFGAAYQTMEGGILGTADYMSPEQAVGRPATIRSDLYSLGSVFYALLAGRPPFAAPTLAEVLHGLRFDPPVPVRQRAPDTPAELESIIAQLLEKDPDRRIATARAVSSRLLAMEHALSVETRLDLGAEIPGDSDKFELSGLARPALHDSTPALPETIEEPGDSARDEDIQLSVHANHGVGSDTSGSADRGNHFTTVADHRARTRMESDRAGKRNLFDWLGIAGLAAAVVAIVVTVWFATRPPSADQLYQRIVEAIAVSDTDTEIPLATRREIRRFLARFPGDPRAAEIAQFAVEAEQQQQLEPSPGPATEEAPLSPLERLYLETLQTASTDPELAIVKLEAVLDMFSGEPPAAERQRQCIERVAEQLERLKRERQASIDAHLALIRSRLEQAGRLRESDPAAAQAICRGILVLYGDKPWAADAVRQVREQLQAHVQ